jgi:hypothetical protein
VKRGACKTLDVTLPGIGRCISVPDEAHAASRFDFLQGFTPMRSGVFTRCLMAAVAFAVFTPAAVMAQETKPKMDPEKAFKRRDANGDGSLSEDEFLAVAKEDKQKEMLKKRFGKMESDGDGKLSLDEFKAGMVPPKKKQK